MATMELSSVRNERRQGTKGRTKRLWRMKINMTWKAIKDAMVKKQLLLQLTCAVSSATMQLSPSPLRVRQEVAMEKKPCRPMKSLGYLLQLPRRASDFIDNNGDLMTPTISPKEKISTQWREIHGFRKWEGLLDPLHPWLRREIVKYGEFVEATYDAFDFDPLSEYCGSCRYNRHKLFQELSLACHGYKVTAYFYAMSHVDVPHWFERSHSIWSKDSNWMGFVAVSGDRETERIGRRDIVVAWRGTVAPTEWFTDLKTKLEHIGDDKNVKVECGFLTIYKSKGEQTRYNKLSASEQVMQELERLVKFFRGRGEEVSLTISGHSLGGALALLNAYEAATSFPDVSVSVISFGAPRVGNMAFREKLDELGVKTLRLVVKQDIVPKLPGILLNRILRKLNPITAKLNWVYRHVGTELKLDTLVSPYLKRDSDLSGSHNLETYLHLIDGFFCKKTKFRWNARRDITLVNKSSDMLIDELRIPEFWYQLPHKGLILNGYGRWVKPSREPEDIPSPLGIKTSDHDHCF
ncbi:hypothetical protein SLE2022_386760 [Rubroshorea leprosula]